MPSLQDLVRASVNRLRDNLVGLERELRQKGVDRQALSARVKSNEAHLTELAAKSASLFDELNLVRAKERTQDEEYARKLDELRRDHERKKEAIRASFVELQRTHAECNEALSASRKKEKNEELRLQQIEHEIEALVQKKNELRSDLEKSISDAFETYMREIQLRLETLAEEADQLEQGRAIQLEFEEKKHSDPGLATLYETYVELQRLLPTVSLDTVKRPLELQLSEVREQIEKLYPGALSQNRRAKAAQEIEELFYTPHGNGVKILLPVPSDAWGRVTKTNHEKSDETALRTVFEICKCLRRTPHLPTVERVQGWTSLVLDEDSSRVLPECELSMKLPGGTYIYFVLSELPQEIQDAISPLEANG